jgi:hypothetical protein
MAKRRSKPGKRVLSSEEVFLLSHQVLEETLPVDVSSDTYTRDDLLDSLLYAASQRTTLERTGVQLKGAPDGDTTRSYLEEVSVGPIEAAINEALVLHLPKAVLHRPRNVAVDLVLIPYYGETTEDLEDYIIRSQAKAGTTRFFGYATLYLLKANRRYTLAFRCVRNSESLVDLLRWLLGQLSILGGRIKRLYLDAGFYSVKVLRYLIEDADLPFLMPIPKKGRSGGVRKLFVGRSSYRTCYTVHSPKDGTITVQAEVVCKYSKGKYQRHGIEWFAYATHRYHRPVGVAFDDYRRRFGIESSYSRMHQARARTASRKPGLRALLVGIAFVLTNLWAYLKWACVSLPRRGGRLVFAERFPFLDALTFLHNAIQRQYGIADAVTIPQLRSP